MMKKQVLCAVFAVVLFSTSLAYAKNDDKVGLGVAARRRQSK